MYIRHLRLENVNEAAKLHFQTLPDISSTLGLSYVTKMYKLMLADLNAHFGWGVWENKELIGFVIVSRNMNLTHKLFHKLLSPNTFFNVLFHVITFQVSTIRLIERVLFERKLDTVIEKNYCCLGPLCISRKYQRQGIGTTLMARVYQRLRILKIDRLYVYTRSDNFQAIAFYKKKGFRILAEFHEGIIFSRLL